MLRIGLTGGIGSGKSTVAALFQELGVPVIDADVVAHALVAPGMPALTAITTRFGSDLITSEGELDRARLRIRVFTNPAARQALEDLLHPLIRTEIEQRLMQLHSPYCLVVVPLLVEKGWQNLVDRVLVVDLPPEEQLARAAARDAQPPSQVRAILAAQCTRAERLAAADDIIDNSGEPGALSAQVAALHRQYLALGAAQR